MEEPLFNCHQCKMSCKFEYYGKNPTYLKNLEWLKLIPNTYFYTFSIFSKLSFTEIIIFKLENNKVNIYNNQSEGRGVCGERSIPGDQSLHNIGIQLSQMWLVCLCFSGG